MKKSILNKNTIDLDLTALLDVIFILLMVVMCYQVSVVKNNAEEAKQQVEEAQTAREDAEANEAVLAAQLEAMEEVDSKVGFMTVYVGYNPSNITNRYIRFVRNMQGEESAVIQEIVITPETEAEAYSQFETEMEAFLTANSGMPVLLTLDDSHILYRDHEQMAKSISKLEGTYTNLFMNSEAEE